MGINSVWSERIQVFATDPFLGLILLIKINKTQKKGAKEKEKDKRNIRLTESS